MLRLLPPPPLKALLFVVPWCFASLPRGELMILFTDALVH